MSQRQAEEALIKAAAVGDLATLKRLVEEGVDVNAANDYGNTALMGAAMNGKLDCLEHLIAKGANLNAQSNGNMTALHCAAFYGHAPCVESLLKAGGDASLKNNGGNTTLDIAKEKKHTEVVKLLENALAIAVAGGRGSMPSGKIWGREEMRVLNSDQVYSFLGGGSTREESWINGFFVWSLSNKDNAEWLGEAVEFTPELAVLPNIKGERAIDCAAPECKKAMVDALVRRALQGKMSGQAVKLNTQLYRNADSAQFNQSVENMATEHAHEDLYFHFLDMNGFESSYLSDGLRTSQAGKANPEGGIYFVKNVHKNKNYSFNAMHSPQGQGGFETFINALTKDARGEQQFDLWKEKGTVKDWMQVCVVVELNSDELMHEEIAGRPNCFLIKTEMLENMRAEAVEQKGGYYHIRRNAAGEQIAKILGAIQMW